MPARPDLPAISLHAAAALSGLSVRTWQRRVEKQEVPRQRRGQQTLVALADVQPEVALALDAADVAMLLRADAGEADAQADLGALFALQALRAAEGEDRAAAAHAARQAATALYFLEPAAAQDHADAMQWLATLSAAGLAGHSGRAAEAQALMWTARAAALGHAVAQPQLAALLAGVREAPG